ncbi:hypothetical protein GRF29_1g887784 [Pseudopithomyces chartarum]|uniref:FAD-binding FR-type domain-containing protein n=1 Tax=Pseudopithomyces chartarum TaxID=1892770 RepID=A0AAN6M955_9PLEO|nr:hypothetical protein GRF29_1g887784 [Pseudopithomyces chartarum]
MQTVTCYRERTYEFYQSQMGKGSCNSEFLSENVSRSTAFESSQIAYRASMSRFAYIKGPRPIYILAASLAGGAAYRFSKPSFSNASLDPHDFSPYILVDKQSASSTNAIFTLQAGHDGPEPKSVTDAWKRGIWSVEFKQPQLQVARAYTPLPPVLGQVDGDVGHELRFLIRQEKGGEVSTYLHRLPEGSTIELRGPHVEHELPLDVKEVIFLAGGTGVAPAMQVAHVLSGRPGSKMHLLWANRRREECEGGSNDEWSRPAGTESPSWWRSILGSSQGTAQEIPIHHMNSFRKGLVVRELEALKARSQDSPQSLQVQYYVDEEKSFIKPSDVVERIQKTPSTSEGSRLILVSGPDGFVEYWAGKKLWFDGREIQGPLGGMLGKMDLKDWKVVKV